MAAILDFQLEPFYLFFFFLFFFIYKSLWCFPPSFKSIGFLVQEKKWNIYRFSRWQPWWPSWISNRTILATRHSWPTSHPDTSYHVSSPLVFLFRRRSEKQIFKMAATAAILDFWPEQLSFFLIYKSPRCFLPSFESIGLSVQEKKQKLDFQDSCHGGHLRFPTGMILAIFDLQVTLMLPTKFRVNWPFDSEEAKTRFSRWWPSWISDRNDFSYFWSSSHPDASYHWLCWGLTTHQPLWVILCRLPEKGRKEIVEEMKVRTGKKEERGTKVKVKKQKK